jgi:hypothetical protein
MRRCGTSSAASWIAPVNPAQPPPMQDQFGHRQVLQLGGADVAARDA